MSEHRVRVRKILLHGVMVMTFASSLSCVRSLAVSRSGASPIWAMEVDQIFGEMTRAVAVRDGPGDFACLEDFRGQLPREQSQPLVFNRLGNVGLFGVPAVINSRGDYLTALGQPGYVKIFRGINWCDGVFQGNLLTCRGSTMLVIRLGTRVREGQLWAHAFGHTVGLPDRLDGTAIMDPRFLAGSRRLNAFECTQFARTIDGAHGASTAAVSTESFELSQSTAPADASIEELARGLWVHGTPFVTPDRFTSGDVATLVAMLEDPVEREHRGSVVALLGMLGGPREAELLMDLVSASRLATPSLEEERELTAALMGLGYLANRTASARIVAFLRDAARPGFWALDAAEAEKQLRVAASIGLGLSGRPEASLQLSALRETTAQESDMTAAFDEIMKAHAQIASGGLAAYYAR